MRKKHIRSILSIVLCFAMVLSLMFVSNVEASEKKNDSEPALEYVVIDNPSVTTPGTQKVVVGYSKGTVLSDAVLTYKNVDTEEEYSVEASDIQESAVVFEMSYEDDSWTGTYSIEDIAYTVNGEEYSLNFSKCGIEGKFAVNQICETDPDAVVEGEKTEENMDVSDADVSFTAITQDGTIYEEDSIADVINDAIDTQSADSEIATYAGRAATRLVVVLDPGHGGFDPGAIANGTNEKTLTLKIAQYCKAALERNGRIQVYMTREADTSVGGATNTSADLKNRVAFAASKNADLFVSIHLNSAGAAAYGAEVYYPNSNYRSDIGQEGQKLASSIQKQLVSLGLYNRGVKIRQSENGSTYPDGSVQDYYAVIQQSKRNGFPGIIVEHAFLTNASDYQKYLSSDEKLKTLGEADAQGIIEYINNNVKFGSWQQNGSQWMFTYYNGAYAKNCWEQIDGYWYHFDGNGIMQTGWLNLGETWYYLNANGAMATGWLNLGGTWYYLNTNGAMAIGWAKVGNTWYYMNASGAMQTGWLNLNGTRYYLNANGAMAVAWLKLGDNWYYLNPSSGAMQTGWLKLGSTWYYLNTDGTMATGWLNLGGMTYYLNEFSGAMQTGWLKQNGIWYFFNNSGARIGNCWYWVGNSCYYFDKDGKMAADTWIGDYYVNADGAWIPGMEKPVDKWINTSGRWWYRHADGSYTRLNWEQVGNQWYYFDKDGWMVIGWLKLSDTWYYMNTSGARVSNCWTWVGNSCYYFDKDGKMAADTWIGDYYVNADGAWIPGQKKDDQNTNQNGNQNANQSGSQNAGQSGNQAQTQAQWINTSGRWWYRHADGSYTKSNWEQIGNQWYYFDKDGWMMTGYQAVSGTWYYLQKSASPEGALTYTGVTPIMGNSDLSSDKNTVVNKMVRMFQRSGRTYPADKLNAGGAGNIETFCQIVYDEAVREGVKPEIVFGQAMKETGYLQFGGAVKIEQFNFAGLGATGGSVAGAQFSNVTEGIRAQVQHLKAYASKDNLTQGIVDPRFQLVTRGSAPYVEWLGQKENPNGFGWATAWNYGISLMNQYVRPMYSL